MLVTEANYVFWKAAQSLQNSENQKLSLGTLAALGVVVTYLGWYLWRFTIFPSLYPDEPKPYPYLIPWLGHTISFFRDSDQTLSYGREYFQNTREPFSLTIAGEIIYVLSSPYHVSEAFKNTTSLSRDEFVRDLMAAVGSEPHVIYAMYEVPSKNGHMMKYPNPQRKHLGELSVDIHKFQLSPNGKLQDLTDSFRKTIDTSLRWESLQGRYVLGNSKEEKTISLFGWCSDVLLRAATNVYFGESLLQVAPDVLQNFLEFDLNCWQLIYSYPKFLSKEMHAGKQGLLRALIKYFELPREERQDATWFVHQLEDECRNFSMSNADVASVLFMIYWVVNTNTFKLCFWILSYVMFDHRLLDAIREETSKTFMDGDLDMGRLMGQCQTLDATLNEVLRQSSASASVRRVVKPARVGGTTLKAGPRVMMPYRQLHFNKQVFGEDAGDFKPSRFLRNRDLNHNTSFRPFGGGANYCPGRHVARQEVYIVIAMILRNYDISLGTPGQKLPQMAGGKPSLGLLNPVKGSDLILRVKPRAT